MKHSNESKDKKETHVTLTKKEHEELLGKVKELEELRERFVRSAADFENAKKRLARDKDEFAKFAQERFIRDVLPVLDNLERALSHVPETEDSAVKGIVSGIQMVFKQFNEILKTQGLKRVESVGKPFDPHQHEAVGFVQEKGKEDLVVDEVEPGYFLHDRLLRAAKVRVGASAPTPPDSEEKKEEIK